jgi:hypothetical protein
VLLALRHLCGKLRPLPIYFACDQGILPMFGYTEEQIAAFGMSFGVGGLMLYMLFIIAQLAWESKAGKFGFFVMMLGLAFGMVGFVAKYMIQWFMNIK